MSTMVLHKIIASVFDWIYGERVEIFVQIALLRWSRTAIIVHVYSIVWPKAAQSALADLFAMALVIALMVSSLQRR